MPKCIECKFLDKGDICAKTKVQMGGAIHDDGPCQQGFESKLTPTTKFKVGDKVRVVAANKRLNEIGLESTWAGHVGEIISLIGDTLNDLPVLVKINNEFSFYFAEQDLELVEFETGTEALRQGIDTIAAQIRTFETGATRDSDADKFDYEGFLSPIVLRRYAQYMHKHRKQSDGTMRASDNWQKGIPIVQYMKSKWRHFMDTWSFIRQYFIPGQPVKPNFDELEESLCAEMFNTSGMLYEVLKERQKDTETSTDRTKPVPGGC